MRTFGVMLLALCLGCTTAMAQGKKAKKNREVPTVTVDTVCNSTFSYAYGQLNTQGLMGFLAARQGVDTTKMDAFLRGFDSGATDDEFLKALKAYVAGAEIRQQVENSICKGIDQQLAGNDTVTVLDHAAFIQGFRDAVAGEAKLSFDSASVCVDKNMKYHAERVMSEKYGDWKQQNSDYLTANAKNKDVKVTASGLQYKVLVEGDGKTPVATDRVKVHYEGQLIDGTVFDSSYKRNAPATFGCNQVIPGWTEALTMMPVGSKWQLFIPSNLAYGERDQREIKPFSTLVFTVELLSIEE